MLVYRLVSQKFADLSGGGGLEVDGRWHHKGRRIVYTAATRSLAVLEKLVHLEALPEDLCLMVISLPEAKLTERVIQLPTDWTHQRGWTQDYGSLWLKERRSLVLRVPSAIVPLEWNYLINPDHAQFNRALIRSVTPFKMDERLFS